MKPLRIACLLIAAVAASAALGQEPAPTLPPDLAPAIAEAERVGQAIYRHDQAAWLATDTAMKLKPFKRDKRVRGWITQDVPDGIRVWFVGAVKSEPEQAFYEALISAEGMLTGPAEALDPPRPLTASELAMFAARTLATESEFASCSNRYNAVVLPQGSGDQQTWVVYVMPAFPKANVLPAGGNYRFEVSHDGSKVLASRPFTKSCFTVETDPRAVAAYMTHLLDPVPTEIHVFLSLTSGTALAVMTTQNDLLWMVERGTIRLLENKQKP